MEYGKIIAVTGLPGLFELLSSKNDGAIVRSLEDKSSRFVSSRVHNFSHLESIEVFTVKDNVNLVDIFHAMEKDGSKAPDGKDAAQLKKYFEKVFPDLDFERVYSSDLKKMVKWFDILKDKKVEIKLTEHPEEPAEAEVEEKVSKAEPEEVKTKTEKKEPKAAAKKAAPKKKVTPEKAVKKDKEEKKEKEKPVQKAAKKSAPKKK